MLLRDHISAVLNVYKHRAELRLQYCCPKELITHRQQKTDGSRHMGSTRKQQKNTSQCDWQIISRYYQPMYRQAFHRCLEIQEFLREIQTDQRMMR